MLKQILWTACVTPFDESGEHIDYTSLERLMRIQAESGNGIILFGSTGEGLSLKDDERLKIAHFACDLKLSAPIMFGVPSHNLYSALEWLEFCENLPIIGYLMTTPIYTKPGIMGQTTWFDKLLSKTKKQAMLYNIPGRAGVKLHPEAVKNLSHHKNFVAIKDSSGSVDSIVEYKIAAPDVAVYCGDDYLMHAMAAEGAAGLISVASNAWPTPTRRYVEHSLSGRKLESKIWWQACKALFAASNPIPVKALLKDIGFIEHDAVRTPLSLKDLPTHAREELGRFHNIMCEWRAE